MDSCPLYNEEKIPGNRKERTKRRTILANQRTFNSMMRSGLAALGVGLFIAKFLGEGSPINPFISLIGFIVVFTSIWFYIWGYWNYKKNFDSFQGKEKKFCLPIRINLIITLVLIFSSLMSLVVILDFYILL